MPTIITHAVFSGTAGWSWTSGKRGTVLAGILISILPDLDVVAFAFGIPYRHPLGHRGITHSLAFAALSASVALAVVRRADGASLRSWLFLFVAAASHPLLDAFTNGGRGVALLAPFSNERFFAPFRPIEVSPIGLEAFLSPRGVEVLLSEFVWVWIPTFAVVAVVRLASRYRL